MKNAAHVRNNKQAAAACRQKRLQGTATPSQDSGRARKTGHKKGILSNLPHLMPDNLFVAACIFSFLGTARLGRIALLGAAGFGRVTCLGIALRVAASASRSFGRSSGSPLSAAFLFELPQQLTIATAAMTTTKEKIFFISVKGLIISYSVTSQRYIFVRILQIKISDIFKACVCCWQAGHRLHADRARRRKRSRESNLSVQKVCHRELLALHECLGKCRCDLTLQDDGLLGRQAVSHHDL